MFIYANSSQLTWRDVQYLIVYTSKRNRLTDDVNWAQNGAGRWFHPNFAFGALDTEALVSRARNWINVPSQLSRSYAASPSSG